MTIRSTEEDYMANHKMTIFIAGDSTAEIKTKQERPESGWGEFLADYFDSSVQIKNHAMGGRSTKSFIHQKRFEMILNDIKKGDYLLIQFGHNDQKREDPLRFTEPYGLYQENLKQFIFETRKKKATPILITSISRRVFKNEEIDRDSLGEYPKAMRQVAEEENVSLIDMNQLSIQLLNQFGEEDSKQLYLHLEANQHPNYPDGIEDNTHFSESGARYFSQIIAQELGKEMNEIKSKLK